MKAEGRKQKAEVIRAYLRLLTSAFCLLTSAFCSGSKQKPADENVPVTVAKVEQKDVPLQLSAIGNVQAFSTVSIRALVGGQLTRVSFREGDDVRKGQQLFTIDPRPFEAALQQAQANLARDEAQYRNAQSEAVRYADLVKKDYVTKEEYEKITSAAEAAKAVVAADHAALENAQLQLSYCNIVAPIDGRTGSLMVHAGNVVRANDTNALVVINQVSPVYVQFAVPEGELARLRARGGLGVPVTASPKQGGSAIATGKLSFIDNAVDTATGTIALKAVFGNQDRALWPGQFVSVAVTLQDRPNAVVVPSQAVQTGQRGQFVYVVREDRSIEVRPVKVAETVDQQSIIETGVGPGEMVVTDGQLRLTPKSHVDVKNAL
ncbi:MAG TPA: efflux RND transporter periplasmic adaptor subunit [Thermoanaerobaculia bacterium]|nr:efflux RND transporter periplasmic adaptor subunit [Thermoanaerobaculia bacterium]